jgi:hypothetical protein
MAALLEDGPVPNMAWVGPVAGMGCVAWASGRTTVNVVLLLVWEYATCQGRLNPRFVT